MSRIGAFSGADGKTKANMTLRVFSCKSCGHHMRMSGPRCGYCFSSKSPTQRLGFWLAAGVVIVLIAARVFL